MCQPKLTEISKVASIYTGSGAIFPPYFAANVYKLTAPLLAS